VLLALLRTLRREDLEKAVHVIRPPFFAALRTSSAFEMKSTAAFL
jgi:hypothetical protein